MRQESITTNEWQDATMKKPWRGRDVLVLQNDGTMSVLRWNGYYWTDRCGIRRMFFAENEPIMFYIYEKLPEHLRDKFAPKAELPTRSKIVNKKKRLRL